MKRLHLFYYLVLTIALQPTVASAKNMITFFIRPFPNQKESTFEKLLSTTQLHGKISYKILKQALNKPTSEGILATYYGYLNQSNFNGQITFPRKHQRDLIEILITPMIEPIMMIGATVHHWQVIPELPANLYTLERKRDEKTETYYWNTKKKPLEKDERISVETIVLFAHPEHILIRTGITPTTKSSHLLLPDMYAKNVNTVINALRVLNIKHFFAPVTSETKKQNDTYYSKQW